MRIKTTTKRKQMKDEELPHAITPKSLFYSVLGVLTLQTRRANLSKHLSCEAQPETLQILMAIWKAHFHFSSYHLIHFGGDVLVLSLSLSFSCSLSLSLFLSFFLFFFSLSLSLSFSLSLSLSWPPKHQKPPKTPKMAKKWVFLENKHLQRNTPAYIYICCEVIIWSKFGVFKCYYLVQVGVFKCYYLVQVCL